MSEDVLRSACAHAERVYPEEACGLILGDVETGCGSEFTPLKNIADGDTRTRFEVSELEHIRVLECARSRGLRPLAFFHSHPDAKPEWSIRDQERARVRDLVLFPNRLQIIVSVIQGRGHSIAAYRFSEESPNVERFDLQLWA